MRGIKSVLLRDAAASPRAGRNELLVVTVAGAPASTLNVNTASVCRPCCVATPLLVLKFSQLICPGVPPLADRFCRPEPAPFAADTNWSRDALFSTVTV